MSVDELLRELASLRAENKRLRDQLTGNRRGSATVRRAVVDAHSILMNAFAGDGTGRIAMGSDGMTKHRWAWAVALLRYAGVVSMRTGNWRRGLAFAVNDLTQAVGLLESAAQELSEPGGYTRLKNLLKRV